MTEQPFVSGSCRGEKCFCGADSEHKVEETIFHDDPLPHRHGLTAYLCHEHFRMVMGPAADRRRRVPARQESMGPEQRRFADALLAPTKIET
ncbi:hypothetical protein ACRQ5Q_15385 [Bradyrhizobium sp. PMVTL-01]|uniref:hypothetical protein n=1 Tax=Bradyrhizobium sp. PMVTL-01 TaxID=3434999 RepID=UPI003F6EBC1E